MQHALSPLVSLAARALLGALLRAREDPALAAVRPLFPSSSGMRPSEPDKAQESYPARVVAALQAASSVDAVAKLAHALFSLVLSRLTELNTDHVPVRL